MEKYHVAVKCFNYCYSHSDTDWEYEMEDFLSSIPGEDIISVKFHSSFAAVVYKKWDEKRSEKSILTESKLVSVEKEKSLFEDNYDSEVVETIMNIVSKLGAKTCADILTVIDQNEISSALELQNHITWLGDN